MLHFLYNMMVHGTVRVGDGLAAAHGATPATVLFSLAASRQSVCLSQNVLDIIQWQSSLSLSMSHLHSLSLSFSLSSPSSSHTILLLFFFLFFAYPLHHTLSQRTSHCLSASWNHNHNNCKRNWFKTELC